MPELSNLLRQRLGAAEKGAVARPDGHPDADTLTAYVERLLPEGERQKVLTHLATCGACRDVVALSQPQLAELATQPVFTAAPVSRWRKWFAPAFGIAATAAAVIAIMVLQGPQMRQINPTSQPAQEAKVAPLPDQTAADKLKAAAPEPAQPSSSPSYTEADAVNRSKERNAAAGAQTYMAQAKSAPKTASARDALASKQPSAAPPPVFVAEARKKDFINTGLFAANSSEVTFVDGRSSADYPAAPQPQPSASTARFTANAPGQITIFSDIPANANSNKSNVRILPPPPRAEHFGCTLCKVVEKGARSVFRRPPGTAPAISSNTLTFSAMGGQGKFSSELQKGQPSELAAAPEKSEGSGLEQSDALSRRARSTAGAAMMNSSPQWKIASGRLVKSTGAQWQDAYPAGGMQFTVVNARGSEVWAGGTDASLIHSRDSGANWENVKLGETASGTIVSIVFAAGNILVKTSEQSWSSSDGGRSWVRQEDQK